MGIILGEFIYNDSTDSNIKPIIEINESVIAESKIELDRDIAIFDIGSVLLDGNFKDTLLQDPRIPNEYVNDIINAWYINDNHKFTETCSKKQYVDAVYKRTPDHLKYLIPTVEEIVPTYMNILPHTYSLLNELRKDGYKLYYLSNWDKWSSTEYIKNGKMDFLKLFDGGIFSCDVGCMKPDEKIYKILLDKYQIDPNRAIFFDDRKENIEAANKLGIKGILFNKETGADILKDFLLDESTNIFTSGDFDKYKEYGEARLEEMTAKERNNLRDNQFGIPELRKYPLHDKNHVEQAIKMFNHVEKKYEVELADNLLDAMEKYHISTDVVGDKNRLKKYIKEDTITEGLLLNDNSPKDIKDLKEKIKDITDELSKVDDIDDIVNVVKDSLKNRDFKSDEKKLIYDICRKVNITIHGYTIKTSHYNNAEISNSYTVIGAYKDYILRLSFLGARGIVKLMPDGISINYDKSKCDIPKNVAFDFLSMLSPNVDKVTFTKRSIKISALSNSIDSGYPRVSHKYSKQYNVKKNFGGFSITLSTMKDIKESSPVAGAVHRQDYQPDAVYIVNYLKKNTFVRDLAICKDKMSSIFVCDEEGPKQVSLSNFAENAEDIKVYRYINDCNFRNIVESSRTCLDFYRNMTGNENVEIANLESDYNFTKVDSYLDELKSLEECIINSAPKSGVVHEVYCPIIPLVNLNSDEDIVHYFRDIDGVFAQNIDTLSRSASYKNVEDIPTTTINLLRNI